MIRNPSANSARTRPSLQIRRPFVFLPDLGQRFDCSKSRLVLSAVGLGVIRLLELAVDDRLRVQTHPALHDRGVHSRLVLIENHSTLVESLLLGLKVLGLHPTHYSGADRKAPQ